jgi:hypothetical protein
LYLAQDGIDDISFYKREEWCLAIEESYDLIDTYNEYTDEVLCASCLNIEIEKSENELTKKDIDELRGDELRQRAKDDRAERESLK